MYQWMNVVIGAIPSDAVPSRHYFMEHMQEPMMIWGIRGLGIVVAVGFFLLYRNMKRNSGE